MHKLKSFASCSSNHCHLSQMKKKKKIFIWKDFKSPTLNDFIWKVNESISYSITNVKGFKYCGNDII